MTDEHKEKIIELRKIGIGYRSIAAALDLSRDKVRNFCKAQGIDGYGAEIKKKKEDYIYSKEFCKNFGTRINEKPTGGRPKAYCSQKCKRKWEENHPTTYQRVCYYCRKEFESRVSQANFCSTKCYIRDRFWRKEDVEEVVRCLEEGTSMPNAPGWIRNLIMGIEEKETDGM
ncbi:hypothetical protein [Psychrobacillus sp. FSL K6-1415]|uniref:hypothetical protein n=1 Tax=Psychrobacillus sp. FSL K6-1415 TaxID=2921544 RepID=UPI0030F9592C